MIAIAICVGIALILSQMWVNVLSDERYHDDARRCYGCQRGWCELTPDDPECERYGGEDETD
jgi:hypothetical protein